EVDVAVGRHAGAGGDEAADDDVLLQTAQVVDAAGDGRLRQHARGLLERLRRQRRLGNAEEQGHAVGGLAAPVHDLLVLFHEAEAIDLLVHQEVRVAHARDADAAEHLAADHLDVLVVDGHGLRAVNLLDLVHQVALQLLDAEHGQHVVRIDRTVDVRIARAHTLHLLHVHVHGAGNAVLVARTLVGLDDDAAHALHDRAVMHGSVELGDDGLVARMASLEQLDHARQTAGDVLGLRGGAGDLRQDVARVDLLPVMHHDVGAGREQVLALVAFARLDDERGSALLGGRRFDDDHLRETGDFVRLLANVLALDDVLELHLAAELREHGRGERIPLHEHLTGLDVLSIVDLQRRSVHQRIALLLARARCDVLRAGLLRLLGRRVFHDEQLAVAVDDHQIAVLVRDRGDVHELDATGGRGFVTRLLGHARGRTTDVERTHRELRARLADGLGGDDADRLADVHAVTAREVSAVALRADAATRLAGEHGADEDPLDAGRVDLLDELLVDLLVRLDDDVAR